ncbi:MAG: hypothetical protein IJ302_01165 [Clostridia bacterium]|nr:hypothetical protein [Clostridia bacterium]
MALIRIPEPVQTCLRLLNQAGHEAYIVGGAVRNALLNEAPHDFDITTSALPEEVLRVFSAYKTIPTGIRHGTVTVLIGGMPIEITTYRIETEYHDHRHPDRVEFTSDLMQDCARRDFTVNAMCWHPDQGLIDFFGGKEDLEHRIIRTVGDPRQRFDEDALRILRALRFAARLNARIEPETASAVMKQKDTLKLISKERITAEITGLLEAEDCTPILKEYRPVLEVCMEELKELTDESYHDNLNMIARSQPDAEIRLALLAEGCAGTWPESFRLSTASLNNILDLQAHRSDPVSGRIAQRKLLSVLKAPYTLYADYRMAYDETDIRNDLEQIISDGDCISLKQLDLNGNDLISEGFQGKEIASLLQKCLQHVMEEKIPNQKKDLLAYCRQIHKI